MAVKLSEVNGISNSTNLKYVADEESEKNDIPVEDKIQGTEVLVIESGKTYRMNSSGEWVQKSGSGGSGSDLPAVTSADNGSVLEVINGAWDKGSKGYSVAETTQTVIALQSVTTTASMYGNIGVLDGDLSPIAVGDTCIITFNGTDYTLIADEYEGADVYLGEIDPESQGLPWTFVNYPFFIATFDGMPVLLTETDGTYTVAVTATVKIVTPTNDFTRAVKTITGAPTVRVVTLTHVDDTITADQDYNTITDWMAAGYIVLMYSHLNYAVAEYHNTIEWVDTIYMPTNNDPYLSIISYRMGFDGTITVNTHKINFDT